ncbi:hypothetical protein ANCCEY_10182 [Ancylostoma ceylanicum]|uniref:Alpha-1,3-glucosyltransferase n=1 Tax=Ancylostoma ceylanicum TaxID=53326 RepID=A0A0D6LFI9_9BILA|nr:hypothetical protein ANCCEY_10182 [Ancylostoma ceylanicum]
MAAGQVDLLPWQVFILVTSALVALKVLLMPAYTSTDFECLATIAYRFGMEDILQIQKEALYNGRVLYFQRLSVIATDVLYILSCALLCFSDSPRWKLLPKKLEGKARTATFILLTCNAGLIMVYDHSVLLTITPLFSLMYAFHLNTASVLPMYSIMYISGLVLFELNATFIHKAIFGEKLAFLPLMMISVYSAVGVLGCYIWLILLVFDDDIMITFKKKRCELVEGFIKAGHYPVQAVESLEEVELIGGIDISASKKNQDFAVVAFSIFEYPSMKLEQFEQFRDSHCVHRTICVIQYGCEMLEAFCTNLMSKTGAMGISKCIYLEEILLAGILLFGSIESPVWIYCSPGMSVDLLEAIQ